MILVDDGGFGTCGVDTDLVDHDIGATRIFDHAIEKYAEYV